MPLEHDTIETQPIDVDFTIYPAVWIGFFDMFALGEMVTQYRSTVYINGSQTELSLTGEKLEVCVKVDQYYVAFITYYTKVADESKHLAIYLIDQDYTLLSRKEVFGSATTDIFVEDVDDCFYGLELREPNIILFDFVYTNQHQLTIYTKKQCRVVI